MLTAVRFHLSECKVRAKCQVRGRIVKRVFNLLLIFGVFVFSGCTQLPDVNPNQNGTVLTEISGTLQSWTRGERIVTGFAYTSDGSKTIATGTLAPTGAFTVPLTKPDGSASFTPNFGTACTKAIAITPPSIQLTRITGLGVSTSDGKASGFIARSNDPEYTGTPKTGYKFVTYIHANQAGEIKGQCQNPSGPGSVTLDWKIFKGWNTVLVEYITATDIRYSSDPVPNDVSWHFASAGGGLINITNSPDQLEIGTSFALKAEATEFDGTPIPNPKLVWSSSAPSVVDVSTEGVITAKTLGYGDSVSISVAVKDAPGTGAIARVFVYGLEGVGGTFNLENNSVGTAVRLRYFPPRGTTMPSTLGYTITGPQGWNNNQLFTSTFSPGSHPLPLLSEIPAISGPYRLRPTQFAPASTRSSTLEPAVDLSLPRSALAYPISTVKPSVRLQDNSSSGMLFSIDAAKKIPPIQGLSIVNVSENKPEIAWEAISDLNGYDNRLLLNVKDSTTGSTLASEGQVAYSPMLVGNITFDPTHTYSIQVVYVRGITNGEVNSSRASVTHDFRPVLKQLSASGGSKNGGYKMTIVGYNFSTDAKAFFGDVQVTQILSNNPNFLQVVVPPGFLGVTDVKVKTSRGSSVVSNGAKFKFYDISEFYSGLSGNLTVDSSNTLYYIESNGSRSLVRRNETGEIRRVSLNNYPAIDYYDMIISDSGDIFIALNNTILRIAADDSITTVPLPAGLRPIMITLGADGNLWAANVNANEIVRLPLKSGTPQTFVIPSPSSFPVFLQRGEMLLAADGNVWFTSSAGYGKITPNGTVTMLSSMPTQGIIQLDNAIWIGSPSLTRIDFNHVTTKVGGLCGGSSFARGKDGAFWCSDASSSGSSQSIGRTTTTSGVDTTETIIVGDGDSSYVGGLAATSTGKIWYSIGNRIGLINP
jgi:IPT/TIG domain